MKKLRVLYKTGGFTLIELLVVVAIIGVLASVILASLNDARLGSQYAAAKQSLKLISDATILLEPDGKSLLSVTGNNCSDCVCRSGSPYIGPADLRNLPATDRCFQQWQTAVTAIDRSSSVISGVTSLLRDPWGSPYLLDENEGEAGHPACQHDVIRTVGADGAYGTADDYVYTIPLHTAACVGK